MTFMTVLFFSSVYNFVIIYQMELAGIIMLVCEKDLLMARFIIVKNTISEMTSYSTHTFWRRANFIKTDFPHFGKRWRKKSLSLLI